MTQALYDAYDFFQSRAKKVGELTAFREAITRFNSANHRSTYSLMTPDRRSELCEQRSRGMKERWDSGVFDR